MKKTPCIFITGPSGVGKSTLLRACLSRKWPDDRKIQIPMKVTTRPLRDDLEKAEMSSITRDDFVQRFSAGQFLLQYEIYQELYGLEKVLFEAPQENAIYLQALPTPIAVRVKKLLSDQWPDEWDVKICRLNASEEIIRQRLVARGDKVTLRQTVDRAKGSKVDELVGVDVVIESGGEVGEVVERFLGWAGA